MNKITAVRPAVHDAVIESLGLALGQVRITRGIDSGCRLTYPNGGFRGAGLACAVSLRPSMRCIRCLVEGRTLHRTKASPRDRDHMICLA